MSPQDGDVLFVVQGRLPFPYDVTLCSNRVSPGPNCVSWLALGLKLPLRTTSLSWSNSISSPDLGDPDLDLHSLSLEPKMYLESSLRLYRPQSCILVQSLVPKNVQHCFRKDLAEALVILSRTNECEYLWDAYETYELTMNDFIQPQKHHI